MQSRQICCSYYTLVVRNTSLDEKYPGGQPAFKGQFECKHNQDITVCSEVSIEYLNEPTEALLNAGLAGINDFITFDAVEYTRKCYRMTSKNSGTCLIRIGDWLSGSYLDEELTIMFSDLTKI